MDFIDELVLNLELNTSKIDFENLVDEILSANVAEEEIEEELNNLGGLKGVFNELNKRFKNLFNLDVMTPTNGCSCILISNNFTAKKHLHSFLVKKSTEGGANASTDKSDKLFEEISANAVCNFLGKGSKIIMVGQGHSRLTEKRLTDISKKFNETIGSLVNLPPKAQDDGVDFIVYKPFDNRNKGNIIILGQACVGKHYDTKKPINKRWLNEYFNFFIHPPMTLLSIVHYLDKTKLQKVQSDFDGAIVFDRARIIKYFEPSDVALNKKITQFLQKH